MPGSVSVTVMVPPAPVTAVATAPPGTLNVIFGVVEYPAPPLVIVTIPTPPVVAIPTVVAAPAPPPPTKTTDGGTVYPAPGLVRTIRSKEDAVANPVLEVVIATAVA